MGRPEIGKVHVNSRVIAPRHLNLPLLTVTIADRRVHEVDTRSELPLRAERVDRPAKDIFADSTRDAAGRRAERARQRFGCAARSRVHTLEGSRDIALAVGVPLGARER